MTNRPALNPPQTQMCQEYSSLFWQWAACAPELASLRLYWAGKIDEHIATCPLCQERIRGMKERAMRRQNAVETEHIKNG